MNVACVKTDDGKLLVSLRADDDFRYDVLIVFSAQENKIQATAFSTNLKISEDREIDALRFCNRWNYEKCFPKALIDEDRDFRTEMTLLTDEELDPEYVKENFIRLTLGTSWQFFVEAGKEF